VSLFHSINSVAVTGRITFALARDEGFPLSSIIAKVEPKLQSPAAALIFVALVDSLLLLLPLGSTVAFSSIIGIATVGFQTSYAIPILFKLLCNQPFPSTPFDLGRRPTVGYPHCVS